MVALFDRLRGVLCCDAGCGRGMGGVPEGSGGRGGRGGWGTKTHTTRTHTRGCGIDKV